MVVVNIFSPIRSRQSGRRDMGLLIQQRPQHDVWRKHLHCPQNVPLIAQECGDLVVVHSARARSPCRYRRGRLPKAPRLHKDRRTAGPHRSGQPQGKRATSAQLLIFGRHHLWSLAYPQGIPQMTTTVTRLRIHRRRYDVLPDGTHLIAPRLAVWGLAPNAVD